MAPARVRSRDRRSRLPVRPVPLRIPVRASYDKEDVFGLCDALARAERVLIRSGEVDEAGLLAAAFDLLESGLVPGARRLVSREPARTRGPVS
ncbi:MAG: hypothetical protein ACRDXC_04735 [Acidimicrobiales bacterium]